MSKLRFFLTQVDGEKEDVGVSTLSQTYVCKGRNLHGAQ
jgi:hypothetical protein